MSENPWGYKNLTQYALIERAPITASGLNEVLYTAQHRSALLKIARLFGMRMGLRYQIIKIPKAD